ncbi:hypothetical protein ACFFIY_10550 [Bhargavaea ullalensis]|uniref:DUF4352 domain-containing protein n=1 Tax=Bhargavaea ullalensis TaxID=1265685 RepID=A0ABV2G980_9BACL
MKKLLIFAAAAVLLSACGTGGGSSAPSGNSGDGELSVSVEGMEKTDGFIVEIDGDRVLVNDTYYLIDDNTHLVRLGDGGEQKLTADDLKPGMRADVYHSEAVAMSYPGQAYADVFTVPDGEEETEREEAFRSFLDKEGEPLLISAPQFGEGKIRFRCTVLSSNEAFAVELDTGTHEYSKEPAED